MHIQNHKPDICQTEAFQWRHKLKYSTFDIFLFGFDTFIPWFLLFQTLWTCCERRVEQVNCNKAQFAAVPLWINFCYLLALISNHCPAWHALLYFERGTSHILFNSKFNPTFQVIETFRPDAVPMEIFWLYFAYHIPQLSYN